MSFADNNKMAVAKLNQAGLSFLHDGSIGFRPVDAECVEEVDFGVVTEARLQQTPTNEIFGGEGIAIERLERAYWFSKGGKRNWFVSPARKNFGGPEDESELGSDGATDSWPSETIGEALLHLDLEESDLAECFLVIIWSGNRIEDQKSVGGYKVTIFRVKKDELDLVEWVEDRLARARTELLARCAVLRAKPKQFAYPCDPLSSAFLRSVALERFRIAEWSRLHVDSQANIVLGSVTQEELGTSPTTYEAFGSSGVYRGFRKKGPGALFALISDELQKLPVNAHAWQLAKELFFEGSDLEPTIEVPKDEQYTQDERCTRAQVMGFLDKDCQVLRVVEGAVSRDYQAPEIPAQTIGEVMRDGEIGDRIAYVILVQTSHGRSEDRSDLPYVVVRIVPDKFELP